MPEPANNTREEINSWLQNGCDYLLGCALYNRYGHDGFLKRLLKTGETSFNRTKLNAALVVLRDKEPVAVGTNLSASLITETSKIEDVVKAQKPQDQPSKEPPEILKINKLREQYWVELKSLHPYLSSLPEGVELRKLAVRIIQLRKLNVLAWQRRSHLLESGPEEPKPKPEPVMVPIELLNAAENLRKNICKAEARYKKQDPRLDKTAALIISQKQQLKVLKDQIAAYKGGKNA